MVNFRNRKIRFLINLIFLTASLYISQINAENTYSPNGKFIGKFGTLRSLAQLGMVIPVLQKPGSLIYIPVIGMIDINNANELNIGLGYRQIIDQRYILGGYSFFDYRKSQYNNYFKQITIGLELFFQRLEFRTNIYLPEQKSKISYSKKIKNISVHYDGSHTNYIFSNSRDRYQEIPNYGGDVEAGASLNISMKVYLAYYHFFNSINKNVIDGFRVRTTHEHNELITYEAEVSYDNSRKLGGFIGFSIRFSKDYANTSLHNKMTTIPVRDVDIVVDTKQTPVIEDAVERKYTGYVPLVDLEMHTALGLGGNESQENVFRATATINGVKDVDDILVHTGGELILLSTLKGEVLDPSSPLLKQFNDLPLLILKNDSLLYQTYQVGFWASAAYKEKIEQQFANFKILYPGFNINRVLYNNIIASGVPRNITYETLEFVYRQKAEIKVIEHFVNSDIDPISENVASLQNGIARSKFGSINQRYIVTNFAMEKHATALIVDRTSKIIYYMDSNHIQLSDRQKDILQQSFGAGYSYIYPTTPRQRESWSCAQHTVQNIMDFFEGCIRNRIVGTNRDMYFILEKNLYLHSAYLGSHQLAPLSSSNSSNIDCKSTIALNNGR